MLCLALLASISFAQFGETVKMIQERGSLLCTGHNGSYLGFAEVDDEGNWQGFDIEMCKALAATLLGDAEALQIIPISWAQRFPALQSGDIDVIIKVTGWTMGRDTELGLQYAQPYFYGATQIMVNKDIGAESVADLDGATLCIAAGTSTERITADYFEGQGVSYETLAFETSEELRAAFFAGRCDAYAGWGPNLATTRSSQDNPDQYTILPDVMALEPEGIAMRQGDDNFVDVVNWMMSAMLLAELNGITSENVDDIRANPPTPTVERLLGATPGIGERLGLSDDWAYNVIKQVGNYGEVFDRTLGSGSVYNLDRGINALYTEGGILVPNILD